MLDLVDTAKNLRVAVHVLQHLLEQISDRDRAIARNIDEGAVHAVTLRAPFVLNHDRAGHGGQVPVLPRIAGEPPRQRAVQRRDRNRILDQRARVWCA